eukprot:TRINITY_DN26441_c0_g1_i1.p1 TRINITY_DN26441_c0_g1~~TRINITY_DN26441_c0_g1_i1.p1  ORF type:complete len:241 (+),score=100.64 TRINITY_DN26441_c0_g1_i1:57-779(+)
MSMLLKGRKALITGASRGIGKAIAELYAQQGADLILVGSKMATLEAVAKGIEGVNVECKECDLSVSEKVDALAKEVAEAGGVDILVNNAGVYIKGNAMEGDPAEWERMMAINVNAPMKLTRLLSEKMVEQQWGAVINMGSVSGIEPMSGTAAAYAASKHAMVGWSRSIYTTLRFKNVKVMVINPGFVNTDMVGNPDLLTDRMIQPKDIADVAMLPFNLSSGCVPEEITLRLTLSPFAEKK